MHEDRSLCTLQCLLEGAIRLIDPLPSTGQCVRHTFTRGFYFWMASLHGCSSARELEKPLKSLNLV